MVYLFLQNAIHFCYSYSHLAHHIAKYKKKLLLCCVLEIDALDIDLLYKSLVLLPQDKVDQNATADTELAVENPTNKKAEPTQTLTPDTKKPATARAAESNNTVPENQANEAKGTYKVEKRPFALYTTASNKAKYLATDSNFMKAANALKITQVVNHITTKVQSTAELKNYDCVWCMGIDLNVEKEILALKHPNLLISPDIENLTSVDEKKSMFSALKEFANSNLELFSKI